MFKQKTLSKRGFTIIEVVLVLAIAGLIFLMVFLALPALQRSQRDTTRRNELGEFRTQIVQYQSNNRGRVPQTLTQWNRVVDDYMNLNRTEDGGSVVKEDVDPDSVPFLDPDGEPYCIKAVYNLSSDGSDSAESNQDCGNQDGEEDASAGSAVSITNGEVSLHLTWDDNKHEIYAFNYARCSDEGVTAQVADGSRLVAFVTKLEGAGIYCGEN